MDGNSEDGTAVTDEDIQRIVEAGEAGVGDLLAGSEPAEDAYIAATTQAAPGDAYSSVTWAADSASVADLAR